MTVTLRITLGIFLTLASQCSPSQASRRPRESPLVPPPHQNATEINNRDLNKILTDDPKTELLETKIRPINNVHNLEAFPLRFGKPEDDFSNAASPPREETKDTERNSLKDKDSRAIDLDSSKFWASKNNVFTNPPAPDIDKFHETEEDDPFETTFHSSFFSKFELTTPKAELFDKKYKETVESVDQKIDEGYREEKHHRHSEDDPEEDEDDNNSDDDTPFKTNNNTDDYIQIKSIVKNETADKNSIHKDVEVEQIKKINYDNAFTDTMTYYEETTKGDSLEPSSTTDKPSTTPPVIFTRKPSLVKDSTTEKSPLLSNKIETETREPIKITSTSFPSATPQFKSDLEVSDSTPKITIVESTTSSNILLKANVSEQENHIIPVEFITKKPVLNIQESSLSSEISSVASSSTDLPKLQEVTEFTARLTIYTTTENIITTTEAAPETTTNELLTTISPETTTEFIKEITTTEVELSTTDVTEMAQRTSKSLDNSIETDETKTSERSIETTTMFTEPATESTTHQESTPAITENEKIIEEETTTTNMYISTEPFETTTIMQEKQHSPSTTETTIALSTEASKDLPLTSTEFSFIHIDDTGLNQTTLQPETLGPSFNYSTPSRSNEESHIPRNIDNNLVGDDVDTTTTSISNGTNTEEGTETIPSENSLTKDQGDTGGDKGKIAAIAISSVGAVCLVILAGLLYVMRKRQKRLNYGPRCRPVSLDDYSIDNLSVYNSVRRKGDRMSKRSFGNPAFDDPSSATHPLNFPALAKFSNNVDDIRAEYEEIPQISARTSELPEGCDSKNRYANVIPLPESRVFLKTIDGYDNSDYINANYVTGPKNVRGYYIATQGPMENTIDDFWRMIWEQQVKVVLMLTHLVENGLEKCVDYLPESEVVNCSRSFGDFQVLLKRREVKDKYIISTLQLKNMVSNSWREVTHFWYLGWPEKGVPTEANSLIAFLIEARSYMKTTTLDNRNGVNGLQNGRNVEHNPVVVHCSPGTGRTGVAIACDIAIREFESLRLVDIPKIVYKIRRDRAGSVQSKEQYQFIYKVVSLYATKLTGGALDNF